MKGKQKLQKKIVTSETLVSSFAQGSQQLTEYDKFKINDVVWFKASLVADKFSCGTIKTISKLENGNVVFAVWDEFNSMWRNFNLELLLKSKPPKKRRKKNAKIAVRS